MPRSEKRKLAVAEMDAELRSAWTLRLRSGQAREGARPHTIKPKRASFDGGWELCRNVRRLVEWLPGRGECGSESQSGSERARRFLRWRQAPRRAPRPAYSSRRGLLGTSR